MATIYNSIIPNKIKIDYTSNGSSNNLNYNSNFLNVNTWYFGIDVNRDYGTSSKSGWYQGIDARTIDNSVYTIYYTGSTTGRTNNVNDYYRCVQYSDTQDVINFVNSQSGFSVADFPEALNWFKYDTSAGGYGSSGRGGRGSNVCVNMNYPNIPTSGLTFALDCGHVASYPWMNPIWYDFAQSAMSGFSGNSRIISHFDSGSLFFNFIDAGTAFEYFISSRQVNLGTDFTVIFWGSPQVVLDTQTHGVFSYQRTSVTSYVGLRDNKANLRFYYRLRDSTNVVQTRQGVTNYTSGLWAQFSYVFETNGGGTTTSRFYYNDTLSEENIETFLIQSWDNTTGTPGWAIGQLAGSETLANNYYGGMAVVLVYNRALSATEISDIYLNYRQDRILFQ